jgi:alanyl-tRNA synthetase
MKNRAYYLDSYTTQFNATVVERLVMDNTPAVILDKTYFYPTSGGQPFDKGEMNGVAIIDVLVRKEDDAVLHMLDRELEEDQVSAVINWQRRFDHMQHHTGQHILSQAFIQVAGAHTIGFHLSNASVTIDLNKKEIMSNHIEEAEQLANEIVWQNRPVTVKNVSTEEAKTLALRKIPATHNSILRLIDIDDFDLTACGGTHVARTGEIGQIKIIKQEKRGNKQRIEFRCGHRALNDYRQKHAIVVELSTLMTTGGTELNTAVKRLQNDNKHARRQLKKQQTELSRLEANHLINQGVRFGDTVLVTRVFSDRDPGQVRALGSQLIRHDGVIALLGLAGERAQLIFCRAASAPGDMKQLLNTALSELGSHSGGGSETFAQGVGPSADVTLVQQAIEAAEIQFLEEKVDIG